MDQNYRKPIFRNLILLLILGLIAVNLFFSYAQVAMDSDFASLVLEAEDILKGNFFLKGWNLTGATFIFSELPYYILANLFFGIDTKTYILASAMMFFGMILAGLFLLPAPRKWQTTLLYFSLTSLPGAFFLYSARSHVGIFVISMAAFVCLKLIFKQYDANAGKPATPWVLYGILVTLGSASDVFILPIIVVPVLLIALSMLISSRSTDNRFWIKLIMITSLTAILGILIEKAFLAIGGADPNSRTGIVTYNKLESLPETFIIFTKTFLGMAGADLSNIRIFSVESLFTGLRLLVLLISVRVWMHSLAAFFRGKADDLLSMTISLGMFILMIFLLVAPFLFNQQGGRYFAYFPIALAVLLVRRIEPIQFENLAFRNGKFQSGTIITLAAIILILGAVRMPSFSRVSTPQDRLATWLMENGLTEGYSDFWQANHVAVASKNQVHLGAIHCLEVDGVVAAYPYYWFSKTEWYENPATNFVVIEKDAYQDVNEENIFRHIGPPSEIRTFENYKILIYEPGIEQRLSGKKAED